MKKTDKMLTIPLYELMERKPNGGREGIMHMAIADSVVYVTGDAGEEIGLVRGCIGGGTELWCKQIEDGQIWYYRPQDVWNAFCRAMERPDLAEQDVTS